METSNITTPGNMSEDTGTGEREENVHQASKISLFCFMGREQVLIPVILPS